MDQQSQDNAQQPFGLDQEQQAGSNQTAGGPVTENEKLLSGLSYVSQPFLPAVLPVVLLLTDEGKRSAFIKHHAVHSLALLVAAVVFEIAAFIVWLVGTAVTGGLCCLLWLIFLLPIVPFVYYGIEAFQGKRVDVPYLTDFLKQNSWL
jgi:uncharacterized membrane protein